MRKLELETTLQQAGEIRNVSADFLLACYHLHSCGIELRRDLCELHEGDCLYRKQPLRILDLCCGSGHAAETCIQTLYNETNEDGVKQENNIEMFGVDINPLPHLIPREVREESRLILNDFGIDGDQMSTLVKHDLDTGIPFPDNYFDYIYSVEGMIYIEDGLRLLEEIYRVLKPGAKAAIRVSPWFLAEGEVACSKLYSAHRLKALREIIDNTPGAEGIFTIKEERNCLYRDYRGGIVVNKPEISVGFTGFTGYKVAKVMTGVEMFPRALIDLSPLLKFVKSAVYKVTDK
jgi:SAM-dependent methyltransferase